MKIIPQFKGIIDFLSVTKRDISDNQVSKLNREDRRKFKKIKGLFEINQVETLKIIGKIEAEKTLVLDYVLVSQDMKIIDRPYNLIFNYATKKYEPCLVILFAIILVNGEKYPINFDFWISEYMLEEDETYLSKNQIAKNMVESLVDIGLKVDNCLMDAGFNCDYLIQYLNDKKIEYTCRAAKNKSYKSDLGKSTAKTLFMDEYNGEYYFYKKAGYMNKKTVDFCGKESTLVVVSNTREKLMNRDFYCLISTETKTYTEIFRSYKNRFKIEVFFRNMKSYIGLGSSRTHNEDKISNHISLCIFGYIMVEILSTKMKKTFFQTLMYIQTEQRSTLERKLYPIFKKVKGIIEKSAFQPPYHAKISLLSSF